MSSAACTMREVSSGLYKCMYAVLLIVSRPIHPEFLTYEQKVSVRENVGIET